ncbi:MAG: hypothetical protein QOF82_1845, partial [Frankiales bacterium]|nr:hypothetical protein [Frankiales bacterium]
MSDLAVTTPGTDPVLSVRALQVW